MGANLTNKGTGLVTAVHFVVVVVVVVGGGEISPLLLGVVAKLYAIHLMMVR